MLFLVFYRFGALLRLLNSCFCCGMSLVGRRAMTTGLAFARTHKSWRMPAVAAVLVLGGAVALAAALAGIAGS